MTAFDWIKSSYSGTNEHSSCVEVAVTSKAAAVRDSKAPVAGHITLPRASWSAFLTEVRG
jgi:hypothetical protein